MFLRKSRGFTIIELLVVISVILILAAILTPAVHKAKAKAKRVQCLGNIRQMGQAALMYAQDWDEKLPRAAAKINWYQLPGIADARYLRPEVKKCANEPWKVSEPVVAGDMLYCYSIYMPVGGDVQLQLIPSNVIDALICDNTKGSAAASDNFWDTAGQVDYHEGDGGNVFYVSGTADFRTVLDSTAGNEGPPPNYAVGAVTMTRFE
ncbi:MAG: type II secretion system protein [Candidatus Aureabacteria bacterium]|nr:type II secretion system protein [Candidatus Auribacterota bacterium]